MCMDLTLVPGILEQSIDLSRKAYPGEACGLIAGRGRGERLIPIKNNSSDPHRFEMDPAELIAALRGLRESGEALMAIFHSHPYGPAEPSRTDVEQAYYPEAAYLIVSLAELDRPQVLAFRILDGDVLPVEVHVIV
jgi:proteasome lid subunit RPN8/RPN11